MDRTTLHRSVIEALLSLRGGSMQQLRLVARMYNDEILGGSAVDRCFIFFPDLHLLSKARGKTFQFGFDRVNPARWIRREQMLEDLCAALIDLREAVSHETQVQAVQAGDFVDLWRERHANAADGRQEDVQTMVDRILADHPAVRRRLVRTQDAESLEPDVLLGNHDLDSRMSIDLSRARRSIAYSVGGKKTLFLTHGDLFDAVEIGLPDVLQKFMVRNFAEIATGNVYQADRTVAHNPGSIDGSQGAAPLIVNDPDDDATWPDWVNVWVTRAGAAGAKELDASHGLLRLALDRAASLRTGAADALKTFEIPSALAQLRTVVVGHSHYARICIHRDAADPTRDLCLLDTGGWIEEMHFGPGPDDDRVPSCTIGVLAGGDARIYQLDPSPALFSDMPV